MKKLATIIWLALATALISESLFSSGTAMAQQSKTSGVKLNKPSKKAGDRQVMVVNDVEYAFRWCPPGTFMMGSPETEKGHNGSETQHKVKIKKGFWMLETEVTQKMWESVMKYNPYVNRGGYVGDIDIYERLERSKNEICKGDKFPMNQVTWSQCREFCSKLSAETNKMITLPTEAQWEYACRAGANDMYGVNPSDVKKNAGYNSEVCAVCGFYPAGTRGTNAWGLCDMNANLWEWCEDWFSPTYSSTPMTDPTGPQSGSEKVIRGGETIVSGPCRSAERSIGVPGSSEDYIGFRFIINIGKK